MEVILIIGETKVSLPSGIPLDYKGMENEGCWQVINARIRDRLQLHNSEEYDIFLLPSDCSQNYTSSEERLQPELTVLQLDRYLATQPSDSQASSKVCLRVVLKNLRFYPIIIKDGKEKTDLFVTASKDSAVPLISKEVCLKVNDFFRSHKEDLVNQNQLKRAIEKLMTRKGGTGDLMCFIFEDLGDLIIHDAGSGITRTLQFVSFAAIHSNLPESKGPSTTTRKRKRISDDSEADEEVTILQENRKRVKKFDSAVINVMDISEDKNNTVDLTFQILDDSPNCSSSTSPCTSSCHQNFTTAKKNCLICYDVLSWEDTCFISCSGNHTYCCSCLARSIRLQIEGSEDTAVQWPTCPLSGTTKTNQGCNYELKEDSICQILNRAARLPIDEAPFASDKLPVLLDKLDRLTLRKMSEQESCIRCPKCPKDSTAYWVSLSDCRAQRSRIDCPFCEISFCSKCSVTPYHYFGKCEDVNSITIGWYDWKQGKEEVLLKELQSSSNPADRALYAQYKAKLDEYKTHYGEDLEEEEIQAKLKEIEKNEKEMEKTCKICPHCGAPATKISGCDHVVCGGVPYSASSSARGGKNGCGKSFNWGQAVKYQSKECRVDITSFAKAEGVKHEIAPGVPMTCDLCTQAIVGPRIRCINCPSYNICFSCIPKQKPLRKPKKKLPPLPPALVDPNYSEPALVDLLDTKTMDDTTRTTPVKDIINLTAEPQIRAPLPRKVKKTRTASSVHERSDSPAQSEKQEEITPGVTRRGKLYQPEILFVEEDIEIITPLDMNENPKRQMKKVSVKKKKRNDLGSILSKRYEAIKDPIIAHDPSCHICQILLTAEPEAPVILSPPCSSSSVSSFFPAQQVYDLTVPQVVEEISLLD